MTIPAITKKLAVVLNADVVGYSRLMGHNERATISTITKYRNDMINKVQKHNGKVIDSPGDNLMAEFSSAVDAVTFAINFQKKNKRSNDKLPDNRKMLFRIGIHIGEIFQESERIYGDSVNISARVQALGDAGGVCISGTVYEQVKNKMSLGFAYKGERTAKNIKHPVHIYYVFDKLSELPMVKRQKLLIFGFVPICIGLIWFLYHQYMRYILADSDTASDWFQTVSNFIPQSRIIEGGIYIVFIIILVTGSYFLLINLSGRFRRYVLKGVNGMVYFTFGFFVVFLPSILLLTDHFPTIKSPVYASQNLFVQILENRTNIHIRPNLNSKIVKKGNSGDIFLLQDVRKTNSLSWNKIPIKKNTSGWVIRISPPKLGIPAKRLSSTDKFYLYYYDIIAFLSGTLFFLIGFIRFKIRSV